MSNPVETDWLKAISERTSKTLEIDPELKLRLVCGVDTAGQPMFCSISKLKPGIPDLSEAVEVTRNQRSFDDHWVLLLTLKAERFTDVFVQLCAHITDRVSETRTEAQGLHAFSQGVEDWRTLLQAAPSQRLSLEATRGLFGELWLGFVNLVSQCSIHEVMNAWNGPAQSDQDFQFPGGPLIEVKTVHSRARRIQISSENQLDCTADERMFIGVVTVDNALADTPRALTVPGLLAEIDQQLELGGVARWELSRRLQDLRFDRFDDAYSDMFFLPIELRYFRVANAFPRVVPAMLPSPAISRVSYSLDLAEIASFECGLSDVGLSARGKA